MALTKSSTQRADATRNRQKILDAARAALTASSEASLQSIAKAAGVGQGTLYRHFPTRDALIVEVHRRDVTALVQGAPALLRQQTGANALRAWLGQLAQYGRIKHGLLDAVYTELHEQLDAEGSGPVLSAIGLLLDAGRDDGTLHTDLHAEDVLLLLGFLWRADPGPAGQAQSERLLTMVLNSLTRPPAPGI